MTRIISEHTNWRDFQNEMREAAEGDKIGLDKEPQRGIFNDFATRIISKVTGWSPVTYKVRQMLEQKVGDKLAGTGVSDEGIKAVTAEILDISGVSHSELNSVGKVKVILDKLDRIDEKIIAATSPQEARFNLTPMTGGTDADTAINVVFAMMGVPFDKKMLTKELLTAVFIQKNPNFVKGFEAGLKYVIEKIEEQLKITPDDPFLDILLGSVLSLVPFCEPEEGEWKIPQMINGEWKTVVYKIEELDLTPGLPTSVPAYGFVPKEADSQARPLLVFRGTPHPSAMGSLHSVLSDIIPGYSVGEYMFDHYSKETILKWVDGVHQEFGPIDLFGTSLGGSLSLITMAWQPDKIGRVQIYGPASLQGHTMKIYEENKEKVASLPQVNVFWNKGDSVPLIGEGFHKDWKLFKLIIGKFQDPITAHASLLAARPNVVLVRMDTEVDAKSTLRKINNIGYKILCVVLLPLTITAFGASLVYYKYKHWRYPETRSRSVSSRGNRVRLELSVTA